MEVLIRPFRSGDRLAWDGLWRGYQQFYKIELAAEVSETTWRRLVGDDGSVHGFGAFSGDRMVGLAHYVLHRSTWLIADTCYLQDLFVAPETRGKGVARKLIEAVYGAADAAGAEQVYWLTHHTNRDGRRLYDRLAKNAGFIVYERFAEVSEED